MKQLHPRSIWSFFISYLLRWISLFIMGGVYIFFFYFGASTVRNDLLNYYTNLAMMLYWGFFLFVLVLCYLWAWLSYRFYKYELTDTGFKKESGIIYKRYVTIPYERIQNVDIYRGILARILGLSDLHIQTAGMSAPVGKYGSNSEGRLPGLSVQVAEELRDELVKRAQGAKSGV